METYILSKTTYLYGCQCQKRLWLNRFKPGLKDPISAEQAEKFTKGIDFGLLARELFPGGIDVTPQKLHQYPLSAIKTAQYLLYPTGVIYEATFISNGVMCAVDILEKEDGIIRIFEVKNSTALREEHLEDAALQLFVILGSGIHVSDFSIIYRVKDNQILNSEKPIVKDSFIIESVLERITSKQSVVEERIDTFKKILNTRYLPEMAMGPQCQNPYTCNFIGFCSKPNIFNT